MKAVLALAATVAVANAALLPRQLDQIPQCALQCALTSLGSTGCGSTDFACICGNSAFVSSLVPCVQGACTAAEFEQTVQAASGLCSAAGVTLSIPSAGASSTAPPSSEASSSAPASTSAAESSTSAAATTSSAAMTETSAMSSSVEVSSTAAPTTSAASSTSAPTTSKGGNSTVSGTAPPQPTGTEPGAASRNTVTLGGLGAIIALVAAFL